MRRLKGSLVWKLTIWFLLLSFLPLAVMTIFVRHTVSETLTDAAVDDVLSRVKLLANEVSSSADDREVHTLFTDIVNQNQFAFLVGQEGIYLAHSDRTKVGEAMHSDFSAEVAQQLLVGGEGVVIDPVTGQLIGFTSVPAAFSTVVLPVDGSVVSTPMGRIESSAIIQLAVSITLVAIAGSAVIWIMFKPIRTLTRAAEEVGSGNFSVQVDSTDMEGELEVLANSFNQMTQQLQGAYDDLEQRVEARTEALKKSQETERQMAEENALLAQIGRIISSTLDIDEVYERFTLETKKLVKFDRMAVNIIDHDAGVFVFKYASGIIQPGRQVPDVVPLKGTQTQRVMETGRALVQSDLAESAEFIGAENFLEMGLHASIMVPLISKGKVFGTLSLRHRQVGAYGMREQSLLERLANQIAPAIENAELYAESRELAILEERNRMAREIHDTLAQGFTGIVLQLEGAEQAMEASLTEVSDHLSRAKALARECLQEARRSVWNLLPHALEQGPLDTALREEISRFKASAGWEKADFSISGKRRELPPHVQAGILRVCQESLANAMRHANASEVSVTLTFSPEVVELAVQDDGIGFDAHEVKQIGGQGGFGLTGMEQRAEQLGGTLLVNSQQGGGTRVEVRIPR